MIHRNLFKPSLLAGRARLTITNPAPGRWIKLHMKRLKDKTTGKPGNCYFLSIALLGDGDMGYRYAGAFFSDTGNFKPARDLAQDPNLQRVTDWVLRAVRNPELLSTCEIEHAGKCCSCGRTLTHPESIGTGLGPECFERVYGDRSREIRDLVRLGLV